MSVTMWNKLLIIKKYYKIKLKDKEETRRKMFGTCNGRRIISTIYRYTLQISKKETEKEPYSQMGQRFESQPQKKLEKQRFPWLLARTHPHIQFLTKCSSLQLQHHDSSSHYQHLSPFYREGLSFKPLARNWPLSISPPHWSQAKLDETRATSMPESQLPLPLGLRTKSSAGSATPHKVWLPTQHAARFSHCNKLVL